MKMDQILTEAAPRFVQAAGQAGVQVANAVLQHFDALYDERGQDEDRETRDATIFAALSAFVEGLRQTATEEELRAAIDKL